MALISVIGALAARVSWTSLRRFLQTPGSITSTDAPRLWAEAERMRAEYREELRDCRKLGAEMMEENRHLHDQIDDLQRELRTLRPRNGQ